MSKTGDKTRKAFQIVKTTAQSRKEYSVFILFICVHQQFQVLSTRKQESSGNDCHVVDMPQVQLPVSTKGCIETPSKAVHDGEKESAEQKS
jgi:hypothetical protein